MTERTISGWSTRCFLRDLLPLLLLAVCVDSSFIYLFLVVLQTYLPDQPGGSAALPGYALAAFGTTKLVAQVGTGFLSDRLGRRPGATLGLIVDSTAVLFLLFVPLPLLALPFGTLYGLGNATIWPALEAEVADRFPEKERGRVASFLMLTAAGAMALGLGGGALLIDYLRFQPAVALALGPLALGLLLTRSWPVRRPGPSPSPQRLRALQRLWEALGDRRRLLAALLIATYTAGIGTLIPAFRPYALEVVQVPLRTLILYLLPAAVVGGAVTLGGGLLSDRFGRYPLLVGGLTAATVGLAALLLTTTPWQAGLIACLLAAGLALTAPGLGALSMDLAGDRLRGTVLGFFMTAEGLGQSFGPALGGYAVATGGPRTNFHLAGALYILALVVVSVLWLQARSRTADVPIALLKREGGEAV